ncbi:50S ribosomal protein L5 [Stagnimonas aquatica]|uniref:Large ribosomal subunit protein uL5 n=1 Tax=Stagnimonas aquatica TaxID=2689987 RepID=A0A3N0VH40_9GAMM|nr:50S ribosomal protein L5 [Stagnimonas aquatica]ROH92001.1 50S ribosomal protein L5 [Stagnimonas aquatica]
MTPNFQTLYQDKIATELKTKLGCNAMAVPRIKKITLNMGVGETTQDKKVIENALADMTAIAGQKPVITKSKIAISNFKIRENYPVGVKVTLRRERMWEFLERLVCVALPRIRDFRGLSPKGFDGAGNYNFGITEQIIFPEIEYEKVDALRGMNITITTSAKTDAEGKALLEAFQFPFRK